ncbi:response regulator [Sphingomonas lycopersici]|uniref:Response regulator n=1 Tax=Sphingomonas lycopersici TaxID=2951807 RepID=A0AA41Z457_9SPHN|nr:response regulator [Sphingomonas lycopersici]
MPRILVADDDDLLGELLRFKLESVGYEVTVVGDGEAALGEAQSGDYDLVVLDAMMPVLSGPEVLRVLRGAPRTDALPIVMLTSRKAQTEVAAALRSGANDYLTKPFIPDELVARVRAILKAESGRGRNAA